MTSRRSNRVKIPGSRCKLCMDELMPTERTVIVRGYLVCLGCALAVHDQLRDAYQAPEVTAMERVLHRRKNGNPGWKPQPNRNTPGWVYYIRMGDKIKIGYAVDVSKRMRAYPPNAELLAAHPGTPELERQMHRRFADHLSHGREWFNPAPEIITHIETVVDQFGDQSALAYQYTQPKTQEEKVAAMFTTRQHVDVARGAHSAV